MGHFIIDEFDFEIDSSRSSVQTRDGKLDVNVVGDEGTIKRLMLLNDHPWNWLIQPPFLYMRDLPCQVEENGDFEHDLTDQELDDFDIAMYIMEHWDVLPCHIEKRGRVFVASGQIRAFKKLRSFRCEMNQF